MNSERENIDGSEESSLKSISKFTPSLFASHASEVKVESVGAGKDLLCKAIEPAA